MDTVFLKELIPKILNPIPVPVLFWAFILILLAVFAFLFKKIYDSRGD